MANAQKGVLLVEYLDVGLRESGSFSRVNDNGCTLVFLREDVERFGDRLHSVEETSVTCEQSSHLDKSLHDSHADFDSHVAVQDGGKHGDSLFGKNPRLIPSAPSTLDFV